MNEGTFLSNPKGQYKCIKLQKHITGYSGSSPQEVRVLLKQCLVSEQPEYKEMGSRSLVPRDLLF